MNNTMNMKTFDSGLNIISLNSNNKILKIEDKNVLFFDIEMHPELHECLSCFEDNILNEFILSAPSTIDELVEIVKEQYDYWGVNEVNSMTVYDYDDISLRIGIGFRSNEDWEYMTVISPMITFTLK